MYVGRERGDNKSPVFVLVKYVAHRSSDRRFAHGRAGALDVGAFAKQQQNALLAYFRNALQIYHITVDRRVIDFKVARVEHRADGRRNGQRARPRD